MTNERKQPAQAASDAMREGSGTEPSLFISQAVGRMSESRGGARVPRDATFDKMSDLVASVPTSHFAFLGTSRFSGGGPETKSAQ